MTYSYRGDFFWRYIANDDISPIPTENRVISNLFSCNSYLFISFFQVMCMFTEMEECTLHIITGKKEGSNRET